MERKIWQQASAEPMASPSGRACEVSKNLSRCPMCFSTSCSICYQLRTLLFCFSGALQQFVDPCAVFVRFIQLEKQFRRTAQFQISRNLSTYETYGSRQTFQRPLRFIVVALNRNIHASRTCIIRQLY